VIGLVGQRPSGVGAYTGADRPPVQVDDGWLPPVEDNPPPPPPPKPNHRRRFAVIVLVVAIAVALVVLVVVPLPHPFSESFVGRSSAMSPPSGSRVTGSWENADFYVVTFIIVLNLTSGQAAYWSNGSSGSFSFTATGSPLIFEQAPNPGSEPVPIQVTGNIWYTVL